MFKIFRFDIICFILFMIYCAISKFVDDITKTIKNFENVIVKNTFRNALMQQ